MVKHTQTIRRLLPMNCLTVFDHFVELALEGLRENDLVSYQYMYYIYKIILCLHLDINYNKSY